MPRRGCLRRKFYIRYQVGLVENNDPNGGFVTRRPVGIHDIGFRGGGRIDYQKAQVRTLGDGLTSLYCPLFQSFRLRMPPCGIEELDRHAVEFDLFTYPITGGAGEIGNQRGRSADEPIEQRRLSAIGRAD